MASRQKPTQSSVHPGDAVTIIGPEIQVRGRIEGSEDLRVEGQVEGQIRLSETLYVEAGGIVVAEIDARDVVISGVVVGNVTASNSITLNKGAKLVGDLHAPRVIISDGAAFRGNVAMGGEMPKRERSRATTAPARQRPTPKAAAAPAPARAAAPAARTPAVRAPLRAPTPPAARVAPRAIAAVEDESEEDTESTVVVRHAALRGAERGSMAGAPTLGRRAPPGQATAERFENDEDNETGEAPAAEPRKLPPRARVPARGKRKVGRR